MELFYPSLHSNPRNPPIKAFLFSLLMIFSSLSIRLSKGKEEEVKAQGGSFFMLNLVVDQGASKDHDRSGLSITQTRTGTSTRFVQRSGLDFGL